MTARRVSLALGVSLAALLALQASAPMPGVAPAMPVERAPGIRLAGMFGETDSEKAARLAREQKEADQDAAIADLRSQIQDLQETVRRLTGDNEVLSHRVDQFKPMVDRMQKDFDYKLCTVMAQQVGGDTGSLPCDGVAGTGSAVVPYTQSQAAPLPNAPPPSEAPIKLRPPPSSQSSTANGAPRDLAPGPGSLGTLPQKATTSNRRDRDAPTDSEAAGGSTYRPEYDKGLNLLGRAQYDEAKASFRAFADNHPKDDLAPQAVYWIGNIASVQKDYPNAAHAFAEQIQKYPDNPRAPESMLKLGQSLVAMGQKKEGCFTLGAISDTYPKASKTTVDAASAARKAAKLQAMMLSRRPCATPPGRGPSRFRVAAIPLR